MNKGKKRNIERELDVAKSDIFKLTALLYKHQVILAYYANSIGVSGFLYTPNLTAARRHGFTPTVVAASNAAKHSASSFIVPSLDLLYNNETVATAINI